MLAAHCRPLPGNVPVRAGEIVPVCEQGIAGDIPAPARCHPSCSNRSAPVAASSAWPSCGRHGINAERPWRIRVAHYPGSADPSRGSSRSSVQPPGFPLCPAETTPEAVARRGRREERLRCGLVDRVWSNRAARGSPAAWGICAEYDAKRSSSKASWRLRGGPADNPHRWADQRSHPATLGHGGRRAVTDDEVVQDAHLHQRKGLLEPRRHCPVCSRRVRVTVGWLLPRSRPPVVLQAAPFHLARVHLRPSLCRGTLLYSITRAGIRNRQAKTSCGRGRSLRAK